MKFFHGGLERVAVGLALLIGGSPASAQTQEAKLLPGDLQSLDKFGYSVASWGNTILVGEQGADSAHVFEWVGGTWIKTLELKPSNATGLAFGISVALSEDWAIVGAVLFDVGGLVDSGAAYVYRRGSGTWTLTQVLVADDAASDDYFAASVAIDGSRLVVGSPYAVATASVESTGAAYVFEFSDTIGAWIQVAKLVPLDAAPIDFIGQDVDIDGSSIVVGAPAKNGMSYDSGAAYVFEQADGSWLQTAKLQGDGGLGDHFSWGAVALHRDSVLIGAPNDDDGQGLDRSGAAYAFEKTGNGWQLTQKLVPEDANDLAQFGSAVALDGANAVIGSKWDHWGNTLGSAYNFRREVGGWQQAGKMLATDGKSFGAGICVSMYGSLVAIGAEQTTEQCSGIPFCNTGAAYVFDLAPSAVQYCSCAGQSSCNNDDPHGGCSNSSGQGGVMQASGSGAVLKDDLTIESRWLPKSVQGLVFMGPSSQQRPFGDGQLCVSAGTTGLFRFTPQNSGALGVITLDPGIVGYSNNNFPPAGQIQAGDTWCFQTWYRDYAGPCGAGFNLTNGLKVEFTP